MSSSLETWPQGTTLKALLDDSVRSKPDRLALVIAPAPFTFRELNELIVKAACTHRIVGSRSDDLFRQK